MKTSGIYKIQSTAHPERMYIGSAININRRHNQHLCDLRHNTHHSVKLQRHFNKYSENDLVFTMVEECSPNILLIKEQHHLNLNDTYFNICKTAGNCLGRVPWNKDKVMSKEFSEKMKIASTGNKNRLGCKHSIETINQLKRCVPVNKGKSKLKKEEILEIQAKYMPRKYSLSMLAREYNVTKPTILEIVHSSII
jgi:group I intron endonuclease